MSLGRVRLRIEETEVERSVVVTEERRQSLGVEQRGEGFAAHDPDVVHGEHGSIEEPRQGVIEASQTGDAHQKAAARLQELHVSGDDVARIREMFDESS